MLCGAQAFDFIMNINIQESLLGTHSRAKTGAIVYKLQMIETSKMIKKSDIKSVNTPRPNRVIMCDPEHFRVEYAINPYMTTSSGDLQRVDVAKAKKEWANLKSIYEKLGLEVLVIHGDKTLPDMVFTANQSFPFLDTNGSKSVILSRMRSTYRQEEVKYFKKLYSDLSYKVFELEKIQGAYSFEGNGDALMQYPYNLIWGGYGERTSKEVYAEMSSRFDFAIATLKLVRKEFYHLDTCFSILDKNTVVVQPEAFEPEGLRMIHEVFSKVIPTDIEENLKYFACNCHSPNGKQVITQAGTKKFRADLEKAGFEVIETDTTEYMKSGGSVFCMKMMAY